MKRAKNKYEQRTARAVKTHTVAKKSGRPRLIVFRSNRALYAHVMDDAAGKMICGVSTLTSKKTGVEAATEAGTALAELAKKSKIDKIAFDRNGYKYHGQVKALADAAREAGLTF